MALVASSSKNFIELKASFYKENQIEALIFSYGFKNGKIKNKTELNYSGLYQNYNNYQIPISTNPLDYGILINKIDMKNSVVYFLHNEKGLTIVIRSYTDYNLIEFLKSILIRKYKGYSVYAHNLAKFDIIFLLKYLVKIGNINPIIHNGKIISLIINYGENGQYKIEFKDSLLLLLTSLKSLCSCFKIDESKSIFPHLFVNENNLDYNGEVPNINNFIKISKDEYQYYKLNYSN